MHDELVQAAGIEVPEKVFFKIGEVSDLTGVKSYVLRFWEKEFPSLRPKKSKSGQRRYRRNDILEVARIKVLLWDRKFTIQGAKDDLKRRKKAAREGDEDRVATALVAAPVEPPTATSPSLPAVQVQADMAAARAELESTREEAARLRAELDGLSVALEAARADRARSDGESAILSSKLEESESDLSALRAAHDQLQERHALVATDSARFSAEVERLRDESGGHAAASDDRLRVELLAVREELIRLKARLGTRLTSTVA